MQVTKCRPHARGGGPKVSTGGDDTVSSSPRTWGWTGSSCTGSKPINVVPTHVGEDRAEHVKRCVGVGRPHARGGGPDFNSKAQVCRKSSPRTWGWTAPSVGAGCSGRVVPTHVGVDRPGMGTRCRNVGRPHARGGGPASAEAAMKPATSSPRTWGWTDCGQGINFCRSVVPTHVGVDRFQWLCSIPTLSRPHARGGGPRRTVEGFVEPVSSPRTWGWTGGVGDQHPGRHVVPTHVGVDRPSSTPCWPGRRRPHARGGGPPLGHHRRPALWSSPRTWGWTGSVHPGERQIGVVPTHVGVDRRAASQPPGSCCRPHARGGGPSLAGLGATTDKSSPRTWGWTGPLGQTTVRADVVPTHVGVDLQRGPLGAGRRRRPHARGGGPMGVKVVGSIGKSSPRTWGWTGLHGDRREGPGVVPTHVGVDRTPRELKPSRRSRPHARGGGP